MTLQELFDILGDNPVIILFYFAAVPLTAILTGVFSRDEGHISPWKYVYCALIYLACIPGIFSITLNVYFFLFERISVLQANIYTQILPIVSMIASLLIINKNVDLNAVPGFDRLSGLIVLITSLITAMWILDKTRIVIFSFLPFYVVLIILIGLLIVIRLSWKRFAGT
jgi:hypothetical protein